MNVREYAMIEVWRQGYFPTEYVYQLRVNGLTDAFRLAQIKRNRLGRKLPTLGDIVQIAYEIEPCNVHGFRHVNLIVNEYTPPHWNEVPERMKRLWGFIEDATPEEFYKEFEEIHPFEDGNGRTGKVLYNWMKGTLEDPEFPPNFFGGDVP